MNVALIGYGKMGKMIEKAALEKGHRVVAVVDPACSVRDIDAEQLRDAAVCFEFTRPESAKENIYRLLSLKKTVVSGTTGWQMDREELKALIATHGAGLFFASNFSLGMSLFLKVLKQAASAISATGLYDMALLECHHNEKVDTPSGTAKTIADSIKNMLPGDRDVPISSVRCGHMPGSHTLFFDSLFDTLTISHTARSREAFAQGAVLAAEWMAGRQGFYTMDDFMHSEVGK